MAAEFPVITLPDSDHAAVLHGAAGKPMLARVLDWPFPRLGELAAIVHCRSPDGAWTNITWPGCVGV